MGEGVGRSKRRSVLCSLHAPPSLPLPPLPHCLPIFAVGSNATAKPFLSALPNTYQPAAVRLGSKNVSQIVLVCKITR